MFHVKRSREAASFALFPEGGGVGEPGAESDSTPLYLTDAQPDPEPEPEAFPAPVLPLEVLLEREDPTGPEDFLVGELGEDCLRDGVGLAVVA